MNFEVGKVYSNPFATAFKSQKMIEGDIDHEVKMAQGQLDYIINAANELKEKLGNAEKNIPAWIQDHISKAHSYLHQSNSGYHEYKIDDMNESKLQFKNLEKGDILVGKFPPYKEMEVVSSTDKSAKVKSSKGGVVDIYSTNNYELKENSMKLTNIIKERKPIYVENKGPCWDGYEQIGTKMKGGKEVPNCVPKNEVKEVTHTSQPGEWVGYVMTPKGDKLMGKFKSARGAKLWLSKNNNKLLNTDGVERVGIMGIDNWNKFHAKWAIENVNEMNVNKKFGSKYDIGAGSMGSGTTFWNKAQEVSGDYKTIAHVSDNGKVTFYDKKLPNDVKKHIEDYAKTKTVNEGKMSDINLIAKEAANFKDFVKQFYIEYSNFPKTVESTQWLKDIYTGKTKMESVTTNVNENCGCGGVKTSNPYSLSEFVIKENDYKFGDIEYTAKNMGPVDIMSLAYEYHQASFNKLAGKNTDNKIRVARDLGRLLGKNPMNVNEKGKEPAWLLYPYKGKLINTDEYKEIYKGLIDKLKKMSNMLSRGAKGGSDYSSSSAKAAAKADIQKYD
jgi:hypothetical protein